MPADVAVIIAVHDPARPIERAVASVLDSDSVSRVIVVCHNVEADVIGQRLGAFVGEARVLLTEHLDDIRSPAGPFNHGLDIVTEEFASVMGSDDTVAPGAIDVWRRVARDTGADAVIAPLRHVGGPRVPTPPTVRRRALRGARDRLPFRTAPLGLISTQRFGALRFTEGLATGEDLAFSTRLWFSRARISTAPAPAYYLIHDDAERVTFSRRPLREDLRAVTLLMEEPWARSLSSTDRRAIAVKLWRVNLFGAVHYRAGKWDVADRHAAREIAREISAFSPESVDVLSRAEGRLRVALLDDRRSDAQIDELSRLRRRFFSADALIPVRPLSAFSHDAPLRFSMMTWWAGRG